jgi:hypothetical protein
MWLYNIIRPLISFINVLLLFIPESLARIILNSVVYLMYNTTGSYRASISKHIYTFIKDWLYKKKDKRLDLLKNLIDCQETIPINESIILTTLSKSFSHLENIGCTPPNIASMLFSTIRVQFPKYNAAASWINPLPTLREMLKTPQLFKYFKKQLSVKYGFGSAPSVSVILEPNPTPNESQLSNVKFKAEPLTEDILNDGTNLLDLDTLTTALKTQTLITQEGDTSSETSSDFSDFNDIGNIGDISDPEYANNF